MKFILCSVSLCAVALIVVRATDEEEAKKMLKSMAEDCQKETGATDADVEEMCDKKLPSTKTGKCLTECMLRQFNCMDDSGNFQHVEFLDLVKMATDDNATITMAEETATECKDTKDPNGDKCETAALLMKCLQDGANKRGYAHI